ncbi:MAG: hypothetical protein H7174_13680 [Flavobacterium sp.]|nr:hypothetical protein [Flavobacterium sp.]
MINLFIIISFLTCSLVAAQETTATIKEEVLQPNWSVLLSKLDTTKIKSGVLIDKV